MAGKADGNTDFFPKPFPKKTSLPNRISKPL
jgi:hypothetical protein